MNAELLVIGTCGFAGLSLLLIPLLPARYKSTAALVIIVLNALITSFPSLQVLSGGQFSLLIPATAAFGDILMEIDPLSAWFIMIVNLTLITGALYGTGYMKAYLSRNKDLSLHWIMFVVFHVSMLWVCMLRNSFAFLIAWEIMTLSSLILVLFDHDKANTLQAGINYMIQMHLGVAMLTIAFIWVAVATGDAGFDGITAFLKSNSGIWVIILFFVGFGIKAGFIPLHTWLPYAHPAAPSHVSGVMSGVIVKMGIYGIIRIAIHISHDVLAVGTILLMVSSATALYGILNASVHRDFKKMLAFCTTENIGIVGMGIGMALIGKGIGNPVISVLGMAAALIHALNHSLYKSLLFFTSGNIYLKTHTRNMELLGGLIKKMPKTAVFFLIGALAIGGIPPFNGFISKFLIYSSFIETFRHHNLALSALMIICTAVLSMAGGVSMLTFTKSFGTIFLGEPRTDYHGHSGEITWPMELPLYVISLIMLVIGIFPALVFIPVMHVVTASGFDTASVPVYDIQNLLSQAGWASLILIGLIVLVFLIRKIITVNKPVETEPTWGCGYVAPRPSLQYTGKSFSKSLAKLFGFITIENKKYKELRTVSVFPSPRTYASLYLEFFETRIFDPLIKQFLRIFNFFTFIHNGKIQFYVLYGLVFMVIIIILSVINVL